MNRLRRLLPRLVLGSALLLLAGMVLIGGLGSAHLVSPQRRGLQDYHREILSSPAQFGLAIRSFTTPSGSPCLLVTPAPAPGAALKSRALRISLGNSAPPWGEIRGTIVLLHGHRGRKEDHLPICERFCAAGFRCLLVDLPAHGDHPAALATFGKNEAALLAEVFDEAVTCFSLPPQPAFLFGVSQGGAIALQAAAKNPGKWSAVASVASFASLDRPILLSARNLHPAIRPLAPLATFAVACGAWCRGGLWPAAIRPADAARRIQVPAFIVHGEDDRFIPIAEAREIFAALPGRHKTFRPVPAAGHGRVLAADANLLYPELCAFFLRSLASHDSAGPP